MESADSLLSLGANLLACQGAGRRKARALAKEGGLPEELLARACKVLQEAQKHGFRWVDASDPSFPQSLQALADPPLGLFVRGKVPQGPCVAIVGSRRASAYGKEVAFYLGRELAAAGVWVVSGMARGVDSAAHRGALASSGLTAAVWGCGPDRVYPPENAELAEQIGKSGSLLTEYPPGTPPRRENFPERNRLIAGLASVLVVVEADQRSGALVSAQLALEEGREVMAVPGSVFSPLSAGPNALLRAGAAPVLCAQDILDVLGLPGGKAAPPTTEEEEGLLRFLPRGESLSVDELAQLSGLALPELLRETARLEVAGKLLRDADGRFRRP
jgi:DNA processing protein